MKKYQFSLLRYMHSAVAGELVNIGIVMWVPEERKLWYFISEKYSRLSSFYPVEFDGTEYRRMVRDLRTWFEESEERVLSTGQESFREILDSLVAPSPSCFQWSSAMGGMSKEPHVRFDMLIDEFIERYNRGSRPRRDETEIWAGIQAKLKARDLIGRIHTNVEVAGAHFSYRFRLGWQNGRQRLLEPISFDYLHEKDVIEKANTWAGRLFDLRESGIELHGIIAPPARNDFREVFERARRTVEAAPNVAELVTEDQAELLLDRIEREAH